MDIFVNRVSQQAVSFAIRSGIVVTSKFAIRQCGRYISAIKGKDRKELKTLQERLETKIKASSNSSWWTDLQLTSRKDHLASD